MDLSEIADLFAAIGAAGEKLLFGFKRDDQRCSPRMFYGALHEAISRVERAQHGRYGAFFTVQDLGSVRREVNLRRVRAVIGDFDQPPTAPLRIQPSAEVASGGPDKRHIYFAIDPSDPLSPEEAKLVQRAIAARHGADPQACDLARMLRLPGTYNFKPEYGLQPQPVRLIEATGVLYTRRELLEAFPLIEPKWQPPVAKPAWRSRACDADRLRCERYLLTALDGITSRIETAPGGTQWTTFGAGAWRIAGLIVSAREHRLLPAGFLEHARAALIAAGLLMENTRPIEPWTETQLVHEWDRAFERAPAAQNAPWA